ncbi:hypothetical protein MMC12_002686 [Toensbergia leucococca]|nr:hypothetical protein [Toensbergia leucococca]
MSFVLLKTLVVWFFAWVTRPRPPTRNKHGSNHNELDQGIELRSDIVSNIDSGPSVDLEAQNELHNDHQRFKPSPRMISEAILGLSDGLTVPFALTAGLSSLGDTRLVILGGLAELISGAISMGLGGMMGAKSEA